MDTKTGQSLIAEFLIEELKRWLLDSLGISKYPTLAGFCSPLIGFVLGIAVPKGLKKGIIGAVGFWLNLSLDGKIRNVEGAKAKLRDVIANPQNYTVKEREVAEEKFDQEAIDLIHIRNSKLT